MDLAEKSPAVSGAAVDRGKWRLLWRLARPHQWTKNLVIFAALLFSQHLFRFHDLALTVIAFCAFCAISSFGYVINDITDRDADREHPEKRMRPLASGDLAVADASRFALGLAAVGTVLAIVVGPDFVLAGLTYVALQCAYSLYLKRIAIVDVITIAIAFVLRAFAGGVAIHVEVSPWLVFITFVLALLLALARRRHELVVLGPRAASHRSALGEYTVPLIDQMISIAAGATLVGYMIYTASPEVERKLGTPHLYLTVPFVVLGILRYLYLIHAQGEGGDPARLLFKDRTLLAAVVLWVAADVALLYF
jgi:4-hydroxybenzoate polyprenyltransferase